MRLVLVQVTGSTPTEVTGSTSLGVCAAHVEPLHPDHDIGDLEQVQIRATVFLLKQRKMDMSYSDRLSLCIGKLSARKS